MTRLEYSGLILTNLVRDEFVVVAVIVPVVRHCFVVLFVLCCASCGRHRIWTIFGLCRGPYSLLIFPKRTMQDAAQFVQLTHTLCYNLARAEKATDRKKVAVVRH